GVPKFLATLWARSALASAFGKPWRDFILVRSGNALHRGAATARREWLRYECDRFPTVGGSAIRAAISVRTQPVQIGGRRGRFDPADIFSLGVEGRPIARPLKSKVLAFYHVVSRISGPAAARRSFPKGR